MGVTSFQLINLVGVLAAVSVLSQDMRGQSALFNSRTRPSASQQMPLLRQQPSNQPRSRSREFPMSNLARQPNRQLGGNPQPRQSGSSFRDISRPKLQQANNANQAQRSMRAQPQQTFRQLGLQQELQGMKQQREWLQQQRLQMENGVGSVSIRRNLPQGQQFSSFRRANRISGQTQGQRQRPLPLSGLIGSRRGGVDFSRVPARPGSLPRDQFLRLAVLNNRSPEDIRRLGRNPEQVAELEEHQRQLYYLRLREERLQRQENQRLQETRARRPQMKFDQGTEGNLIQQVLNKSQQQQREQQQQQRQQRLISGLDLANLQKLKEKNEKDALLAKREKIYNLIKLLGLQPIDLFNIVAALEAGISYQAPKEQSRKDVLISDPSYPPTASQPPPMTASPNYLTKEPTLMTNESIHATNEPSYDTSQPARVTTLVMNLTNEPALLTNQSTPVTTPLTYSTSEPTRDLALSTHNLMNTTQSPAYVVSNTPLFTDEPVYWTNDLKYVTDGPARLTSLPHIETTISDQMTSQTPTVTKTSVQISDQSSVVTIPAEQVTSQPQMVTTPSDKGTSHLQNVTGLSDPVTSQPPSVIIVPEQMTNQTPIVTIAPDQVTFEPLPFTSQLPNVTREPSQGLNELSTASHKPAAMTNKPSNMEAPRNRYDVSIVLGMSPVDTTTVSINNIAASEYFDPRNGSFSDLSVPQTTNGNILTNVTTEPANSNTELFPPASDWTRTNGAIAPGSMMNTTGDWTNGSGTFDMGTGYNEFIPNDVQNAQTPPTGLQQMTTNGGLQPDDLFTASKLLLTELISLSESTSNTKAVVNDKVLLQNIASIISLLLDRNSMYNSNNDTAATDPTFMSFNTPAFSGDVNNNEMFNGINVGNGYNNEMISGINVPNSYNNDIARGANLANNYSNEMTGGISQPYYNNGELSGTNFANIQGEMNALSNVQFPESPIPVQTHPFQQRTEMTTSATVANYTEYNPDNFFPENSHSFAVTGGENNNPYLEMPQRDPAATNEKLSMATAIAGMYGIPIDEAMLMLNVPVVPTSRDQDTNRTNTLFSNATTSVPAGSEYVPSTHVQTDASPATTHGNTSATDAVLIAITTSSMHPLQDNAYLTTPSYQVYEHQPAPSTWSHLNSSQEASRGVQNSVMNLTEMSRDNSTVSEGSDRNVVLIWDAAAASNSLLPPLTDAYNDSLSSDNLLETKIHNPYSSDLSTAKDKPLLSQATFPGVNASTNEDKIQKPQTGSAKPTLDTRSLKTSFTQIAQAFDNNVIQLNPGTESPSAFSSVGNTSSSNTPATGMNNSLTAATTTFYNPINDSSSKPPPPGMSSKTDATGTLNNPVNSSSLNHSSPGINSSDTGRATFYTPVNDGTLSSPSPGINNSDTATDTFNNPVNGSSLNHPSPGMNSSNTATDTFNNPVNGSSLNHPATGMNNSDTAASGSLSTLLEDTTTYNSLSNRLVSNTSPKTTV